MRIFFPNGIEFNGFNLIPCGSQVVKIPLQEGRNVLVLKIDGIRPDGHTAMIKIDLFS